MFSSLRLARVFGIDIKVHVSFALILAFGAMQWGSAFGLRGVAFGLFSTTLLFSCVLLHELGHSLTAKAYGIPVKEITLWPFGGVAQLGAKPKTPTEELLISLAGPAVNVVLAGAFFLIGWLGLGAEGLKAAMLDIGQTSPTVVTLLGLLLGSNVILAVFNLIPALPMDGGRVLRALLSYRLGHGKATGIAATVARVIAVAMFAGAIAFGHVMLGIISVVVFFGASREAADSKAGESLSGVRAGVAVNPHALVLAPSTSVGDAVKAMVNSGQSAFAVMHYGRLLGVVAREALIKVAGVEGPAAYVAGAMQRHFPMIDAQASLEDARQKMNEAVSPYIVVSDGERYLGLVTEIELTRHLVPAQSMASGFKLPRGLR
ncbi:MAG: site-2 protease family protein [Myxococcaceae bacterium]|nr:site-2 protease family protein [Myxococcaceae bacterium]